MSDLRPRVLVVDDEPDSVEALAGLLGPHFTVETAHGGEAALERLTGSGPFTVVVTDLRMPGMNGLDLLAHARNAAPHTVRILLTGHTDLDTAIAAVNEGHVFRLLTKPCAPAQLRRALEDAVEQARLVTADRVLLQHKIDEMTAQLLHAERLASLGTMASGVGHELKSILAAFQTSIRFIRRRVSGGQLPIEEDLKVLDWVNEHLANHAFHLLRLGRPSQAAEHVADLRAAASDVLGTLWAAGVTRGARVDFSAPASALLVRLARAHLDQVLLNLVKNAAEALGDHPETTARIALRLSHDPARRFALCEVEDTGCGIPESDLGLVFRPYFTTKSPERGTGLGLSVVKQIVEAHGGKIAVRSVEGRGSLFVVSLPMANEDSMPSF